MTIPNTNPDEPTKDGARRAPVPPPMPPHVIALLASVEVARAQIKVMAAQLETMGAALDSVLAAAQAGHYSLGMLNSSLRDRIARDHPAAGGMPATFGAQPGDANGSQSDPLGRLDSAP